jgi:Family of unknown function (DUF6529)
VSEATTREGTRGNARVLIPVLVGALVAVALGVYGGQHKGQSIVFHVSGFEELIRAKSWMASISAVLAVVQLCSAAVMSGHLPGVTSPSWVPTLHRWSGRLAFFVAVPVAVFCLYGIGFQHYTTRVLVHSLLGCVFFGVFTIKMLALTQKGLSGWIISVLGGLVFAVLIGIWFTSAFWYFALR